jgi:hypothetical protein
MLTAAEARPLGRDGRYLCDHREKRCSPLFVRLPQKMQVLVSLLRIECALSIVKAFREGPGV